MTRTPEREGEGLLRSFLPGILTYAGLMAISAAFGWIVAAWIASVLLSFCIGAFWNAGENIRKQGDHLK